MMPTNASCRLPGGPGTHMQSDHVGMWGICSSCSMGGLWEQGTHCMHCTMILGIQVGRDPRDQVRFLTSHEISQILWDFLDLIGHFEWICVMGDNVFGIVDNQRNFENWVIFLILWSSLCQLMAQHHKVLGHQQVQWWRARFGIKSSDGWKCI